MSPMLETPLLVSGLGSTDDIQHILQPRQNVPVRPEQK